MIMNIKELIMLLPILIIYLTTIIVMLKIAWCRNHFFSAVLSFIGIFLTFIPLFFIKDYYFLNIENLIHIDGFSIFCTVLILVSSLVIICMSYLCLKQYSGNCDEFYLLILIGTLGGILLTCTQHMSLLFLGIELISLPLYGMIGYTFQSNYSLEASIKYILLSITSSTFLLFGISLLYTSTGQMSFLNIKEIIHESVIIDPLFLAGLGMVITGISFKLSLIPFHLWTPDVYQGSFIPSTAFLTTVSKISIFSVFLRLLFDLSIINNPKIELILTIISFLSILMGNLMAVSQNNIKRILGYSSISHLGYLMIGLIALKYNVTIALEAINIYLAGYILSNLGIFIIIGLISNNNLNNVTESNSLYVIRGLFWKSPYLSLIFTIMILSLAGIPMTIGFFGKFYIIITGMNCHLYFLTSAAIIGSIIGIFYYLRIIVNLYLLPPKNMSFQYINFSSNIFIKNILLLLSLIVLFLGLYPQPIINIIQYINLT